jgi:glycosyltransferase involved in cell wall biosynthesis
MGKNNQSGLSLNFQKPVLVYLPCYNCAETVLTTLSAIPTEMHADIECLVIDNQSPDGTAQIVSRAIQENRFPFKIAVIQPQDNIGYAGSQKLAYSLAVKSERVKNVIMLHGDGQYPAELVAGFRDYLGQGLAIVNGCRSKRVFFRKEETPWLTYLIIKCLSGLESALLGIRQKEWHSGFVMYSTDFLRKIPLAQLSATMHIDGEFLMCAAVLGEPTRSLPIYKKYKELDALGGWKRIEHILNVFKLIRKYKQGHYHRILNAPMPAAVAYGFKIVTV